MSKITQVTRYYQILLPQKLKHSFTYGSNTKLELGDLVAIPFGRQQKIGLVWQEIKQLDFAEHKLKYVSEVVIPQFFTAQFREFFKYFSDYNVASLGQVLKLVLPPEDILLKQDTEIFYHQAKQQNLTLTAKRKKLLELFAENSQISASKLAEFGFARNYLHAQCKAGLLIETSREKNYQQKLELSKYQAPKFSAAQQQAYQQVLTQCAKQKFNTVFLDGVTGSGKTEIYFAVIADILNNKPDDGQVLIMLPEILLTNQFIEKFEKRFGFAPDLWHSATSVKKKQNIYQQLLAGSGKIIIGTRSALFLPFKNLKFIIVDEEHDGSYKQEEGLVYHARDMAIARAFKENIPILLASATASLETKFNCEQGKYQQVRLTERFAANLPEIELLDLKKELLESGKFLSKNLTEQLTRNYAAGQQSLLFLNRKGYAPLKICASCGFKFDCLNCDSFLVEHRGKKMLCCHHCGFSMPTVEHCPKCKSTELISYGPGVERIHEEIQEKFPEARIALLTAEQVKNPNSAKELLEQITRGEIDIIIGTQVITKGHHFPKLTLVAVVDSDAALAFDLRANEKLYQLLTQVAGRAGRAESPGKIIIQTYNPENNVLQALKSADQVGFYQQEIAMRQQYNLPPFAKFIAVIISAADEDLVKLAAENLGNYLKNYQNLEIMGPVAAPLKFLRNKYRYRILVKAPKNIAASKIFAEILPDLLAQQKLHYKIDVDPQNFL